MTNCKELKIGDTVRISLTGHINTFDRYYKDIHNKILTIKKLSTPEEGFIPVYFTELVGLYYLKPDEFVLIDKENIQLGVL